MEVIIALFAGLACGYLALALQTSTILAVIAKKWPGWPVETADDVVGLMLESEKGFVRFFGKALACELCLCGQTAFVIIAVAWVSGSLPAGTFLITWLASAAIGYVYRVKLAG